MELQAKGLLNHLIWEIYVTNELQGARYSCQSFWLKIIPSYNVEDINPTNISLFLKDNYHKLNQ